MRVMTLRGFAVNCRPWLCATVVAAGLSVGASNAADADLENAQLAALVRQLEILDRLAAQSAASSPVGARYHFDYARLRQDLARVRTGIEDYLSPRRAQPRDPDTLSGEYQREASTTP
jgi:RAQPRD family integrative conjugative element protein